MSRKFIRFDSKLGARLVTYSAGHTHNRIQWRRSHLKALQSAWRREYAILCAAESDESWRTKYNGPLELSSVEMLRKEHLAKQRQELTNPPKWIRMDSQRWVVFCRKHNLDLNCDIAKLPDEIATAER